jgi:hypothetical protein
MFLNHNIGPCSRYTVFCRYSICVPIVLCQKKAFRGKTIRKNKKCWKEQTPGLPDFSWYQNGENVPNSTTCTKLPCLKWSKLLHSIPIARKIIINFHSKAFHKKPLWGVWYGNIPSGNPGRRRLETHDGKYNCPRASYRAYTETFL